jgi:hypothetical protein
LSVTGFNQPIDTSVPTLDAELTAATSGIIINDGYIPYLTLENIRSFSSKVSNENLSAANWNIFLTQRLKSAISNVMNRVVTNDNKIFEQKRIYYGMGDGSEVIANNDKLVGLKIDFIKNDNIKVKLNRIGLQFSGAVTDLDFYLFNQNTQVATFTASSTGSDFVWVDLSGIELTGEKAGSWFLYYDQTGLTETAINNDIYIHSNLSNFLQFNPFTAEVGADLNLIDSGDFDSATAYIANLDFSVVPDLTGWITYNKELFANAIRLQFGLDAYKLMFTNENARINAKERNVDAELVKLNVYNEDGKTVVKELADEIEILRNSIGRAEIDCVSLPSDNGYLVNFNLNM